MKEWITDKGISAIGIAVFFTCALLLETHRYTAEFIKHEHIEGCPLNPKTLEEHNKGEKND